MSQAETHASILSLPQLVNADAELVRRGRYLTATFLVEAGDIEFLVREVEGSTAAVKPGPTPAACRRLDLSEDPRYPAAAPGR